MNVAMGDFAPLLDAAVASTCDGLIAERGSSWSGWEVAEGLEDLLALGDGRDCAYDRPSIGVSYALWYHGARTHEAIRALAPWVSASAEPLDIVDIGCGTGATACAIAVLMSALTEAGSVRPLRVTIHAADSSPFMVDAAERIYGALRELLGKRMATGVDVSFQTASWTDLRLPPTDARPLIVGGYLFDHSDTRHVDELAKRFVRLGDELDARGAVLFTAPAKVHLLDRAVVKLESLGWARRGIELTAPVWSGALARCHQVRTGWYRSAGSVRPGLFSMPPAWASASSPVVREVERLGPVSDSLFDPIEASLLLDDEQDVAARPDDHPTVVVGAAGSGKSRVLAERVVRTLETARPSLAPRVLVTAFNKSMVDQLAAWVEERMRMSKVLDGVSSNNRGSGWVILAGSVGDVRTSVTLLNRDRLPNRALGQAWPGTAPFWSSVVTQRRALAESKFGTARVTQVERYLTADFLDEELERIIYGQAALSWDRYREVRRRGRRKPLLPAIREVVWTVLMDPPRPDSFVHRRINAYEAHQASIEEEQPLPLVGQWTHVFVDECQDFTESDFRLLACIPPDPQHLFVTGDESQSMHLGPCYRRPGLRRRQWRKYELGGSYRLPLRVCEALEDLATAFIDAHSGPGSDDLDLVLAESRKAAVIGPRPIVIAGDEATIAHDLRGVFEAYRPLFDDGEPRISLAEFDPIAAGAIKEAAPWAELEVAGMLRIKGLERSCVVFSDRATIGGDESVPEWVYTALTRSTSVLVLVLWSHTSPAVRSVIGRLREDRLLFWTPAARDAFQSACAFVGTADDPLSAVSTGD